MNLNPLELLTKAADKLWPDADEKAKNLLRLKELDQAGEFKEFEIAAGNIQSEAKSDDPWTSRARPTFLYVMYVYLLAALPIGCIAIFYPTQVTLAIAAAKTYLAAIPTEMWTLFGAGYLGYVKKRSDDKEVSKGMMPKKFLGLF
jgi:hypothetical protein